MGPVWREYNAPDKAVQFGNLYSRFVGSPVLGRKHDVLRLLYSLAAPSDDDEREDSPEPAEPQINHNTRARESELQGKARGGLNDASSSRVNQRNPHQERGTTNRREAPQPDAVLESEDYSPAEPELLRDLPFTLQGLSSTNLPFESHTTLNLPSSLPLPIVSLLNTLAEPSLLYKSLQQFVRSQDEGLVAQSLRATIGIELRSYLGLIATLEGEIRRAITTSADSSVKFSTAKLGVSLKRIVVWTRDATMGLRLMSLIAEESKSR